MQLTNTAARPKASEREGRFAQHALVSTKLSLGFQQGHTADQGAAGERKQREAFKYEVLDTMPYFSSWALHKCCDIIYIDTETATIL